MRFFSLSRSLSSSCVSEVSAAVKCLGDGAVPARVGSDSDFFPESQTEARCCPRTSPHVCSPEPRTLRTPGSNTRHLLRARARSLAWPGLEPTDSEATTASCSSSTALPGTGSCCCGLLEADPRGPRAAALSPPWPPARLRSPAVCPSARLWTESNSSLFGGLRF